MDSHFSVLFAASSGRLYPQAAQEEVYLKVTSPGLTRVMIALPTFPSRPGTDPGAAASLLATLRKDLDETAVVGLVPEENARLVVVDPANPTLTRQRWRAVGAHFLLDGNFAGAGNADRPGSPPLGPHLGRNCLLPASPGGGRPRPDDRPHARQRAGAPVHRTSRAVSLPDRLRLRPERFQRGLGDALGRRASAQQLTSHRSIALWPAWSADGEWLAFTSFLRGSPQLFILRPTQGYLKPLSTLPGVNSSPSFSPDGKLDCVCRRRRREHRHLAWPRPQGGYAGTAHPHAWDQHTARVVSERAADRVHLDRRRLAPTLRDGRRGNQRPAVDASRTSSRTRRPGRQTACASRTPPWSRACSRSRSWT